MAEVIPQINIDGTKIKNTWTEKEYVTDEVYNALNKAVIDLKNNNNLLDSNSILFREEYNSSSKNLNNAIHQGVYSFTNSAVNAPSGVNGGNLLVTNTSKTEQGTSIITQIAFCHNGAVYARTKNASENFTSWNKLAYITDTISRAIADKNGLQIDTGYLKLSGGKMTGALNLASNVFNLAGDGCYFGDQNVAGGFCLKGANGTTNLTFINKDDTTKKASLSYAGGNLISSATIQGNLSGTATKANSATEAGNINTGFETNEENFPSTNFRQTILGRANNGICARPFCGKSPTNDVISSPGMAFGGLDTHGFIQMEYATPNIYVGAGNANKIYWYKKLAITDSPAFSGTPTAPTPATSVNNTQLATTAFVQSLLSSRFTASKQENGWWRDGNTGIIFQFFSYKPTTNYKDAIMPAINFPISFPNKCILVLPVLYNDDKTIYHDISMQPVSTTNSSVIFHSQLHEPNPLQNITGTTIKALAIGY